MFACQVPSAHGRRFGVPADLTTCGLAGLGDDAPLSDCSDCEECDSERCSPDVDDCGDYKSGDDWSGSTCFDETLSRLEPTWESTRFEHAFDLGELIGHGGYGQVYASTCRGTGSRVAVKHVVLPEGKAIDVIEAEVELQSCLEHPHILGLRRLFRDPDARSFHLVMDLCLGGDLTNALSEYVDQCQAIFPKYDGGFSNAIAERFLWQMMSAVAYLHHNHIMHRDVKPGNFLVQKPSEDADLITATLRLADFGLAARTTGCEKFKRCAGTLLYRAPEVVSGAYDQRADVWSLGVTAFAMCTNRLPFGEAAEDPETLEEVYVQESLRGDVRPAQDAWVRHRPRTRAVVLATLVVDPERRPSCRRLIREHGWLRSYSPSSVGQGWGASLRNFYAN